MTWNEGVDSIATGAIGLAVGVVVAGKLIKDISSIKGLDYQKREGTTMERNEFCFGDEACKDKKRKAAGGECRDGRNRPNSQRARPRGRR